MFHCSTIYNSQDMEATWMSFNRGMDKEDVVHIYNGMSLGYKKEWMDLESVTQSKVSQKEKINIYQRI